MESGLDSVQAAKIGNGFNWCSSEMTYSRPGLHIVVD